MSVRQSDVKQENEMCNDPLFGKPITCCKCGSKDRSDSNSKINREMHDQSLCFSCLFWSKRVQDYLKEDKEGRIAIVGGVFYVISDPIDMAKLPLAIKVTRLGIGHGGRKFSFTFKDGRKVQSNNVWCRGEIPEVFRDQLPDNATF